MNELEATRAKLKCLEVVEGAELLSWNQPNPKTVMVELLVDDAEYYAGDRKESIYNVECIIDRHSEACRKSLDGLK